MNPIRVMVIDDHPLVRQGVRSLLSNHADLEIVGEADNSIAALRKAADLLTQIEAETHQALEDLRDLARGIYPPLLADRGLSDALQAQARKSPIPVEVIPDGIGRYAQSIEAAVYFSVLEALQNVAKYAEASRVDVRLAHEDAELTFEVHDDGRGFDPAATGYGTGLQGIADRLAALNGDLSVTSSVGDGTTITGSTPIEAAD